MFLAALLIMFAPANPAQFSFDAEDLGRVSGSIEVSDTSQAWIISSDRDSPKNRFLTTKAGPAAIDCFFKEVTLQDVDFSARFHIVPPASAPAGKSPETAPTLDESGVVLRATGDRSIRISLCAAEKSVKLLAINGKELNILASAVLPPAAATHWRALDVSLSGKTLICAIDGKQIFSTSDLFIQTYGKIGLFSNGRGTFQVDDVSITDTAPSLTQSLQIRGMTCVLCEAKIENALKALKGVKDAKANHVDGTCLVTLDENAPCEVKDLVKIVEELHYQVQIEGA